MSFRSASYYLSLFLCFASRVPAETVAQPVPPAGGEEEPLSREEISRRLKALTSARLRSASGHFLIIGTNKVESMVLARWAEDVAARLGKVVGAPAPFRSRDIHLVVRSGKTPAAGKILVGEGISGGRLLQRVVLWNHTKIDVEEARRELCRLLLGGYLGATIRKSAGFRKGDAGVRHSVPLWLAEGMAQYIDPNLRGPNMVDVIGRWEKGKLASVADFLAADGKVRMSAVGDEAELDTSMSAVLVNWLHTRPGRKERFRKIIERLDAGEKIDVRWLAGNMAKTESAGQLEEAWDYWLHGRRRVVYTPGTATSEAIGMFKAGLLLYPGNCGIPLTVDFGGAAGFRDLVARRDEEWVPGFCRTKIRTIRLSVAGRGEEFGVVAGLFCEFLETLGEKKSEEKLNALLDKAERALAEFEEKIKKETPY